MPSAVSYSPPTDIGRDTYSTVVTRERLNRQKQYETALKYYLGQHPNQLPIDDDTPNDNIFINLVKLTCDRTCQFVFPQMPTFEIDAESVEPTEDEKYISQVIKNSGGMPTLTKWVQRGFLSGHSFIRVTPNKLTVLDPIAVTVYWKADDVSDVLWYENRFYAGTDVYIEDVVREGENWVIYTYKAKNTQPSYTEIPTPQRTDSRTYLGYAWERLGITRSPYAIPPIIDVAHLPHPNDYYGIGEADQKALQDSINRLASEINRIVRENADPVDVITGADVSDVSTASGNLLTVGSPNAKVTRLSLTSDVGAIGKLLEDRISYYLAIARVVLLRGEAKDLQRVTNASVRTLFLDALAKNTLLQDAYGTALEKIGELLLAMQGKPEMKPTVVFGSPLPTDMTELANVNAILHNMGAISVRTVMKQHGLNPAFEFANIDKEAPAIDNSSTITNRGDNVNGAQPTEPSGT